MMCQINIPKEVIERSDKFAKEVFRRRSQYNSDKYRDGEELNADKKGFEFEFALCYLWRLPEPELTEGSRVDLYDFLLAVSDEKKILHPVKTDAKASQRCFVNKTQFDKKDIDVYLFGAIERFSAEPWVCYLELYGWLPKRLVPTVSELVTSTSNGSEYYQVPRAKLRNTILFPFPNQNLDGVDLRNRWRP